MTDFSWGDAIHILFIPEREGGKGFLSGSVAALRRKISGQLEPKEHHNVTLHSKLHIHHLRNLFAKTQEGICLSLGEKYQGTEQETGLYRVS